MDTIESLCADLQGWVHHHVPRRALSLPSSEAAVVRMVGDHVFLPSLQATADASAHDRMAVRACSEVLAPAFFQTWWEHARKHVPWLLDGPTLTINLAYWTPGGTNLWVRPTSYGSRDQEPGRLGLALQPGGVRPGLAEVFTFLATLGPTHGTPVATTSNGLFWAGSVADAETLAARVATSLPLWRRS